MNVSKVGQDPNFCLMPEMSVESKVERPGSKTSRCRQRSGKFWIGRTSKSLQFSAAKDVCPESTTCVSSFSNNQGQLTGLTTLTNVAFSQIQRVNPLEFCPQFYTSTPVSCSAPANHQVKVSVQYPSKIVNNKLPGTYETIGKALVYGVPSRIAGAIMNCLHVKKHVIEKE